MTILSSPLLRRMTVPVNIGNVIVGGGHSVVVQSMTNTDTADIAGTVAQVAALARAGSELVRITVDRDEAADLRFEPPQRFGLAGKLETHVRGEIVV